MTSPRIFGVDYPFLSCGDVFTVGLEHAATTLDIPYAHARWDDPTIEAQIAMFEPTLIFVVHGRRFAARFPRAYVTFGPAATAVWLTDEPYEVDDTERWSGAFDYAFINDSATLHRHVGATYLPVCYDATRHDLGPDGRRPYGAGFIGGGNSARDRVLAALARAGLLAYVVGGAWESPEVNARVQGWNIPASHVPWWYHRSQIIVNVYREQHHFNVAKIAGTTFNPRVYEATACGALVVTESRPENARVPTMPTFETPDECVDVVRSLLDNPHELSRRQDACRVALAGDTYVARLRTVLATTGAEVTA